MTTGESQKAEPVGKTDEKKEKKQVAPASALWRYATLSDKLIITVSCIAAAAGGVVLPLFSVIFGELTDSLGEGGEGFTDKVNELLIWFVLLGAGSFVVSYIEVAGLIITAENQVKRIRQNYVEALLRQEVGWFDSTSPGEVATRVVSDTVAVQEALGEKFGAGVRFTAQFFAGFIVGFVQGWRLTLVILALSPLLMLAGGFMTVMMQNAQSSEQTAYASAGSIADEVLRAARTIIAFGAQEKSVERYNSKLGDAQKQGEKKGWVQGLGLGLTMFVMFLSYGVSFFAGAQFIIADRNTEMDKYTANGCAALTDFACPASLATNNATAACATLCTQIIGSCLTGASGCTTGGDILAVFFAVLIGAMSLGQAAPSFAAFAKGQGSLFNIMAVIDRKPLIDVTSDAGVKPTDVSGKIEFKNVKMTYPSRPDIVVLDGFNLSIEPGQTVALVGASGCGKSSTMKLVQRFYDVQEGEVLVDGTNIKDLHLKTYRTFLGLVGQEPVLFNTTVKENIRYGNPDASDDEIYAAAKAANAHEFISAFPKKYDTMVGSGSVGMSGGQKQRIAIARALVKQPSILLLDEATSALDTASEREVQKALDKLMAAGKRTTLVIAHRLSTVQNADRIVVVESGKVIEDGSHAELMEMENGAYRQFVLLQSGVQEGDGEDADAEEVATRVMRARSESHQVDAEMSGRTRTETRARSMSKAADGKDEGEVPKTQDELDELEKQDLYKVPLSRLLQKSRPEWCFGSVGVFGAAINGAVMPIWALLFSEMLALFFEPNSKKMEDDAWFWGGMFAVIGAATLLANIMQFYGFTVMGERLTRRLRFESFHAMLGQEIDWFDDPLNSAGALTTRLSNDAAMVQNASTHNLGVMAQNILTIIVGFTIAFSAGWQLTLIILATFPLLVLSGQLQMKAMGGFAMEGTKALEVAGSILTESIAGIQTVKAFGMEDRVLEMYSTSLEGPQALGVRRGHLGGLGFGFSQAVMLWTYALAFWAGSLLLEDGTLTFENFFKVLMSVIGTAMGVGQSASMVGDQVKAKIAVSRIYKLLDRKSAVDPYDENGEKLNNVKGALGFKNIKFAYKTRPDAPIFNGFDLDVPAGSVCALVGASGSGKSTTVSLVERFYLPQDGSVTLDGKPLENLNTAWLRSRIGFVQQEPMLFDCTVAENIRYGKEDATQEEVEAAAKAANAHKFITELSEGYDTRVGQGGGMLSGGQKQRVAIARALVRNPDIMLLDEATSALDTESERLVQAALDELLEKSRRTTLVIAHRLSTIRNADMIVVVHDGKIAEMGTHDELLAKDDHYARLWNRQALAGAE